MVVSLIMGMGLCGSSRWQACTKQLLTGSDISSVCVLCVYILGM